jgi:hypothetical protein
LLEELGNNQVTPGTRCAALEVSFFICFSVELGRLDVAAQALQSAWVPPPYPPAFLCFVPRCFCARYAYGNDAMKSDVAVRFAELLDKVNMCSSLMLKLKPETCNGCQELAAQWV